MSKTRTALRLVAGAIATTALVLGSVSSIAASAQAKKDTGWGVGNHVSAAKKDTGWGAKGKDTGWG